MIVSLRNGDARLDLSPAEGGCVTRFAVGRHDILRPLARTPSTAWDARDFAAFPLFPFCGRISNGHFTSLGRKIALPANMPPEPHAIHGHAWQGAWSLDQATASSAELTFAHDSADWPWAYTARQHFTLHEGGLDLTLSLTNHASDAMPAGFGWHPYFPRHGARLKAATTAVWQATDSAAMTAPQHLDAATDLSSWRDVEQLELDHCFDISTPHQHISWPGVDLVMTADPVFTRLTVFVPAGEDFFCVEPISHVPDAVNMNRSAAETGIHELAPGATLSGRIRLAVSLSA